ncbi:hypothetical protein [Polaribacter septentrionalilitoris]|uniref:hypothetical protein n=1 Tax=Polaribacter septentrionalilitoris TaxID=2494657 RepID=UPI00135CED5C|nr:hypothetical protein [Polaribacter septentrionalilitoris]
MKLKTNYKTLTAFLILSICFANTSNAQFWKKLKKKVQQKIENKVEKETDKKIDSLLKGKKKTKKKEKKTFVPKKSYGNATINHSKLYGTTSINQLTQTNVEKIGDKVKIVGYWDTFGVDVHDGYILNLKNITDIKNLKNKTFKIPEEATLQLDYDALVKGKYDFDQKVRAGQQEVKFSSGTVTVMFNKDQNIMISFNGKANIDDHSTTTDNLGIGGTTIANLTGSISTTSPKYSVTREFKQVENKNTQKTELTDADKKYMKEKLSPTVNIPSTFAFNKAIAVEITDERGDKYPIEFLLGNYPDIWGMSVAPKEMQGQGTMLMVMTPKASIGFMDVAGMKMKKATSLEQMGGQYDMDDKIPDGADFEYKKTGNTKTILGYTCQEYKVDYDYTNSKGSVSFWVSKEFPIQNIELPMLGMKMNNPYLNGFVLELNSTHQGKNFKIKVTNVTDKNVKINSNEYRKMGF